MRRLATYALALVLLALSVGAMAWAAQRPGEGIVPEIAGAVDGTVTRFAEWYRSGPGDGRPDWQAAAQEVHGGDPERGTRAMIAHGCGACHRIPGVTGAHGSVGPDLDGFSERAYVAGVLPNEPGGLVRWIVDPTAHSPMTAMPDLGVTEAEARDMAAHLYTLRGG
ncbi:MAG: c-type cytochrome [Roseicyclus sp.]